ncbi:metallo-beta-lactamase family protein, RNA-specific [Thermus aquaticus Y51MC23]|jgi:predicted metal-dependent RNase|uniref:Ribonuclease n=2 Tax=Thermus aquaticus TaxID=271 RepID=A0A0N0BLL4_THEAQ|nr:metallo-beta-lactamase family protein, RNA-specific [Thermus aquaticus Y51MC23]KOX89596.1 Ribonuclease [Thermus aquaticus]
MRIVPFGAAREVTGSCHLRASVHTLGGFSGHAGQDELLSWLEGQRRVVLVHGEEEKLLELSACALVSQHGVPKSGL